MRLHKTHPVLAVLFTLGMLGFTFAAIFVIAGHSSVISGLVSEMFISSITSSASFYCLRLNFH